MIPTNLSDIINYLNDHLDDLPDDRSREFVRQMADRLSKYSELLFVSWKQRKFLVSLYGRLNPTNETKPLSGLEKFKRRKEDLIKKSRQRKKNAQKLSRAVAGGLGLLVKNLEIDKEVPRMRHIKSHKRQLTKNRLLTKGTKKD